MSIVYSTSCPSVALWDKTRSFWDIKNSLSHERGSERSERANEWAVRANKRTDERVAQYLRLDSWLIQTTVRRHRESSTVSLWLLVHDVSIEFAALRLRHKACNFALPMMLAALDLWICGFVDLWICGLRHQFCCITFAARSFQHGVVVVVVVVVVVCRWVTIRLQWEAIRPHRKGPVTRGR